MPPSLFRVRLLVPLAALLLAVMSMSARGNAEPAPAPVGPLHAWYAGESLQTHNAEVTGWKSMTPNAPKRSLTRMVGRPQNRLVQTPSGIKNIVRFNGSSALWQPAAEWGTLQDPRTILVFARIPADARGVLVDGSTRSGSVPVHYADGRSRPASKEPVAAATWGMHSFVFDAGLPPLGGFILGANVNTHEGLVCDIAEVLVCAKALTEEELTSARSYFEKKWGAPTDLPDSRQPVPARLPEDPRIFRTTLRKHGDDAVHTYRIPGLATTPRGTLIAVFDTRNKSGADLPGDIDVGMMRSTDDGTTWSRMQRIIDFDSGVPGAMGNGVGDPAVLVDQRTGTIFVIALWSRGPRAWSGSQPGLAPEETGQLVLVKSTDDGLTWSPPVNLTSQVKNPSWHLCFNGPGNGIQLRDGTLVFPAQFKSAETGSSGKQTRPVPHSCFIASQDGGVTWKISPPAIPTGIPTSESAIAQLEDGSLLISMRDESHSGFRAWARWEWKTEPLQGKWGGSWTDLPDPTCMASLLRHPSGPLLFSNPSHPKKRVALTVRSSTDGGKTWSRGRLLDPGPSMYSCLSVLRDGKVGVLYEAGDEGGLVFARFPLEWILEGASSPTLPEARTSTTGKFAWWPARHAAKVAEARSGGIDLLFLGDSITQGWENAGKDLWQKHFSPLRAANYGFGGDSTQHVLWRIQNGELDGITPKAVVLLVGTNNVRHSDASPGEITDGIRAILDTLIQRCPGTRILLLGILPRGATPSDPMRQKCAAMNDLLPKLADGKRIVFLDAGSRLLSADGTLQRDIAPDLLHLSPKGYAILAESISAELQKLLSE